MNKESTFYEKYPNKTICQSLLLTFINYILGSLILIYSTLTGLMIYLILILITHLLSWKFRCSFCYYYGKKCAGGYGLISAKLFKKGDPSQFLASKNVLIVLIPSMLTTIAPIIAAIADLIIDFSVIMIILLVLYFVVGFYLNGKLRSKAVCKYCKQKELGCPAAKMMEKPDNS